MSPLEILSIPLGIAVVVLAVMLIRRREAAQLDPAAHRILFPFVGTAVSQRALDATLRLARAEGAVLVPTYLVPVPLDLPLTAAMPGQALTVMPVLEAIERRAATQHIAVDARIERGRTVRHALREAIAQERFDRIVVPVRTGDTDGLSPEDVAWLLDRATCEVLVLRPARYDSAAERPERNDETDGRALTVAPAS
ncbi:MAG: universal stress protein [Solirubrobacteraceae bacterium]|nr:universal stress protein [Solirubrobacteraceae bacterium]